MRIRYAIIVGAMAALTSLAVPALARHSEAPKAGESPAATAACSARQRLPDGSWTQLPCQELGAPEQTRRKSATRNPDQQTH